MINVVEESPLLLEVANHPNVLPKVSFTGEPLEALPAGYYIEVEDKGGFLVTMVTETECTIHSMFLPKTSPKLITQAYRELFFWCFINLEVDTIWSSACESNRAARRRLSVGKPQFDMTSRFDSSKQEQFASMSVYQWVAENEGFKEAGDEFHKLLGEDKNHEDDAVHDAFAGLVVVASLAGKLYRAINIYNRWAVITGYEQIYDSADGVIVGNLDITIIDGQIQEIRVCQ